MPKPSLTPPTRAPAIAALLLAVVVAAACGGNSPDARSADAPRPAPQAARPAPVSPGAGSTPAELPTSEATAPLLVAAGDIACVPGKAVTRDECQMEATARLVESLEPDVVAPIGDLQYERGEAANFAASYMRTWGRFLDRTRPAPGNHEYAGGRAKGYYGTFGGAAAGVDGRGWYSYDVGEWHVVVLNSVCRAIGGCGHGSPQLEWLRRDLAASSSPCTLAYWHHARWSSGLHGTDAGYEPFWSALAADGADVVISGHDHHYERFAPKAGIRQFVAGTGGRSLYPVIAREDGSQFVETSRFGVLALALRPDGYDWRFHAILRPPGAAAEVIDSGSEGCRQ